MSIPSIKGRLAGGGVLCVLAVDSGSPAIVEMAGGLGFSAVALDARHGPLSPFSGELEAVVRAATSARVPALVRAPEASPGTLNRCLNDGADGVVVPAVGDAAAARAAVEATRYPPLGRRGAAPVVRAARYGLTDWDDYVRETNGDRLVLCSLEGWEAVDRAGEIAAVRGIDGVVLDLPTLALGTGTATPDDARLGSAVAAVTAVAGVCAVICADVGDTVAWAQAGARLVIVHGDLSATLAKAVALRRSLDVVPSRVAIAR